MTPLDEIRDLELATHIVWARGHPDGPVDYAAVFALMDQARRSSVPELACAAVERTSLKHMVGFRGEEAGPEDEFLWALMLERLGGAS